MLLPKRPILQKKLSIDFSKLSDEQITNVIDLFVEQHPQEFEDLTINAHTFNLSCVKVDETPVPKKKVKLIMGNITFLNLKDDGEHKAIIHGIDAIYNGLDEETAGKIAEDMLGMGSDSYLILPTYSGEVVIDEDLPHKEYKELFEKTFGSSK